MIRDPLAAAPAGGAGATVAYAVTGHLETTREGALEGWVWSPERPGERLIAELLVDGARVAAMVAARPRRDLAERRIGDGMYGFTFRPSAGTIPADGPVVITARERRTGQVFARLLREGPAIAPAAEAALAAAQTGVDAVEASLSAARERWRDAGRAPRLRDAFAALGDRLAARARDGNDAGGLAAAQHALRRRIGPVRLSRAGAPALSVVMPVGGDAARTLDHLRILAPALDGIGAEALLVDEGADPRGALIPALAANVVYLRPPDRPAEAMLAARGRRVALLEGGPEPPSRAALMALAGGEAAAPGTVLLGPAALAAARRVGAPVRRPATCAAPGPLGLLVALDRDLLRAAGGLDPVMRDGAGLDGAELWRRCALLGARAVAWTEPPCPPAVVHACPDLRILHPPAALDALAAYRDRWGTDVMEPAHG